MSFFKLTLQQTLLTSGSVPVEDTEMDNIEVISGQGDDAVYAQGSNNNIDLGSDNDIVYVSGSNTTVSGTDGDKTTNVTGDNNNVNYDGAGTHNSIITGNNNDYKAADGDSIICINGSNNSYETGDGTISAEIEGDSNYIAWGDGDTGIKIKGNSNSVKSGNGEQQYIDIEGSANNVETGFASDNRVISVKGDENSVKTGDGDTQLTLEGNTNDISVGTGEKHCAEIKGNGNSVNLGDGEIYSEITGNTNNITFGNGDKTVYLTGNSNIMGVGNGNTYMELQGDKNNVKFGDGNNNVGFIGNKNNVEFGDGNNYVAFWGDSNKIKAGNGDNFVESLDIALQRGNFSKLYDAWYATLPTSTWSSTTLIDVKKKVKSKCAGLKKKITVTYTYQVNTYKRYHVNGPTNSTVELGSGNNTVAITGGAKVSAGKNTKNEKAKAWAWDELINTYTYKKKKSKTKWNWKGIATGLGMFTLGAAIMPIAPVTGTILTSAPIGSMTLDNFSIGFTGKAQFARLTGNIAGIVSKSAKKDYELFTQGWRENKFVKTTQQVATIAGAVVAGFFTGGLTWWAIPIVGAGIGVASTAGMAGASGQQASLRQLAAGATAGAAAVGAAAGVSTGLSAVGATSTTMGSLTSVAATGAVAGVTASSVNQLIMNNGFNSREMWKAGAIGAGSAVAMAGISSGRESFENAYSAAQADGQDSWSSFGNGISTGLRTTLNTMTGGISDALYTNIGSIFTENPITSINTINTQNALKVAEYNKAEALENLNEAEQNLNTATSERDDFINRDQANSGLTQKQYEAKVEQFNKQIENYQKQIDTYQKQFDTYSSQVDNYNKILNAQADYANEQIAKIKNDINELQNGIESSNAEITSGMKEEMAFNPNQSMPENSELKGLYAKNADITNTNSQQIETLKTQQAAWENYAAEAQNGGTVSWGTRYSVNAIDNNPVTAFTHTTFNNTILDTPLSVASNLTWKAGELVFNTGKATIDGATWLGGKAIDGISTLGNSLSDGFTSVKNTISDWFTPAQNTTTATTTEKGWLERTSDWFKNKFSLGSDSSDALNEAYKNQELASQEYKKAIDEYEYAKSFNEAKGINENLEYLENNVKIAEQKVFDANAAVDEILYNQHDYNTNSNSLLGRISEAGKSFNEFINRTENTLAKNLLDLTGTRTISNIAGRTLRFMTNNQEGWGPALEYTRSNFFSEDTLYGIKPLYEFSGAKALMGSANDAFGYVFGTKSDNTALFGANATNKITNTIWSDTKSILTPTETNQGNIFQRVGHLVSNTLDKAYNFLNAGGNLVTDIIGLTPIKGTIGLIGQGMKTAFGNEYGCGPNVRYTISGKSGLDNTSGYGNKASLFSTIENKGLNSGLKYTGDAAWDLSGARQFYELGDKSLLYITDNSNFSLPNNIGDFQLSGINKVDSTIVTDGTAFGNGLIKAGNTISNWISETGTSIGNGLSEFGNYVGSKFNSTPTAQTSDSVNSTSQPTKITTGTNSKVTNPIYKSAVNGLTNTIKAGYNTTLNGLSSIKSNIANTSSNPNPSAIGAGITGGVGALAYSNEKRISERKADLSRLSIS